MVTFRQYHDISLFEKVEHIFNRINTFLLKAFAVINHLRLCICTTQSQ